MQLLEISQDRLVSFFFEFLCNLFSKKSLAYYPGKDRNLTRYLLRQCHEEEACILALRVCPEEAREHGKLGDFERLEKVNVSRKVSILFQMVKNSTCVSLEMSMLFALMLAFDS